MQRPTMYLIRKYNVVEAIRNSGVRAVFNLQEPGEHPYCGGGILQSGFSYDPEAFMQQGGMFGFVAVRAFPPEWFGSFGFQLRLERPHGS